MSHPSQRMPTPESDGRGNDIEPENGESRYPPSSSIRPEARPLKTIIEFIVVDGAEGKQLRARQAAVIREALRWFAEHQTNSTQTGPQ